MVRLRRGFGDGKVEAVKLFFAGVETSSGGATVWSFAVAGGRWNEEDFTEGDGDIFIARW